MNFSHKNSKNSPLLEDNLLASSKILLLLFTRSTIPKKMTILEVGGCILFQL